MEEVKQLDPGVWELYDDVSKSRDEVKCKANLLGCEARFAEPNELQLDLDGPEALEEFQRQYNFFRCQVPGWEHEMPIYETSRNGNTHVTIKMKTALTPEARILGQALLGSDIRRELLNYTRFMLTGDDATCFFRPKPLLLTDGGL